MIIRISDISFKYESENILENISFDIKKGEIVSITGPNGSGKTTLLKCLYKSLIPYKGSIHLFENNINNIKSKKLATYIGVVPQQTENNYIFTVREAVSLGRYPHLNRFSIETDKDISVVKEAMIMTDVFKFKDRLVTELSGGEFQRVIIARALAQQPEILLLDEPTLHLDLKYQMKLMLLLKKLASQYGITIVSVIHDLNVVSKISNMIIMLKDKKIFAAGSSNEVLTDKNIQNVFEIETEIIKTRNGEINIIPILNEM